MIAHSSSNAKRPTSNPLPPAAYRVVHQHETWDGANPDLTVADSSLGRD